MCQGALVVVVVVLVLAWSAISSGLRAAKKLIMSLAFMQKMIEINTSLSRSLSLFDMAGHNGIEKEGVGGIGRA